ncbi:DUF368 domain-containing protein [Clostridium carnis]
MKSFINMLKGVAISLSTLVPGVSGGTMAIILGIYDDLIHAISSFFEDWKSNGKLLLELGLGGLVGLIAFSRIIEITIDKYPILTGFFFIGVVCGGIPILYKRATTKDKSKYNLIFLLIGLGIAFFMSSKPEAITTMATLGGIKSMLFLALAGFVIAVALILPGISGSFMLLALGLYDITLNSINNFNIEFLIPLVIGVIIGTLATTKIIEKLLKKFPEETYMLILGFVIGSIQPIYPGVPRGITSIFAIGLMILGFIIIYFLGKREV